MKLHELNSYRDKAKGRVGRGIAAGQGKTAGRGTKGQKARTGYKAPKRIPGLMSASDYRLPKRKGFTSHRPSVATVTLRQIEAAFADGEVVTPDALVAKKVIKSYTKAGVKLVMTGKLSKNVTFEGMKLSRSVSDLTAKPEKTSKIKEDIN